MAIIDRDGHQIKIDLLGLGTVHELNPSGSAVRTTVPITSKIVRIATSAKIYVLFGDVTCVADDADSCIPVAGVEYFDTLGHGYVSVIGTAEVHITEMV